jgi:MFS family permease
MASSSAYPKKYSHVWGFSAPEPLTSRQKSVLKLLWLACLPAAYVNTVFTQTVAYAATEFSISERGQGFAAAIVRWGVIIAIPIAAYADKVGRRRVIIALAWFAPLIISLGALSPSFTFLVATQTIGRPLGIALTVFVLVFATEEMGTNTRAWALSILAVGSGVGAGSAVGAIPLAGFSESSWRLVYLIGIAWLAVAFVLSRSLPETERFLALHDEQLHHTDVQTHIHRDRLWLQIAVAVLTNVFVATASIFQSRYLKEVRGYSAFEISMFITITTIPATAGLVAGGRLADKVGRKAVAIATVPTGTLLFASSFAMHGISMWLIAIAGGVLLGISYPAMAVFRSELFPTAHRNMASILIMVASLIGGSIGLVVAGFLLDNGMSYGRVMLTFALGPVLVAFFVALKYPETAHLELEDINPEDAPLQSL